MRVKYLKTVLFASIFLLIPAIIFSQKIKCEISVNLEQLQSVNQTELRNFEYDLKNYVNDYDWTKEKFPDEIPIKIEIYVVSYTKSSKNYYTANLIVTNKNDLLVRDRNWNFPAGKSFTHVDGNFDELSSVIDFYIFYAIGSAYDTYGPSLGTKFFTKALALTSKGVFAELPFEAGWDTRKDLVQGILSERLKPYRQMKAMFELGKYTYEVRQNVPKAKEILENSLDKMLESKAQAPNSIEFDNFLNANRKFLIDFFKQFSSDLPFRKLKGLDISKQDDYDEFIND
ncbi:DUF4835 family protein [bacterium]|nr:DUF4835 family protein [bacterium]